MVNDRRHIAARNRIQMEIQFRRTKSTATSPDIEAMELQSRGVDHTLCNEMRKIARRVPMCLDDRGHN